MAGEIIEYVDDGYSGTNFNRPAFKRMIEDAKKGKIQVIIVKDLSRLGRDYVVAGDYIEQIFPFFGDEETARRARAEMKASGLAKQVYLTSIYNNRR